MAMRRGRVLDLTERGVASDAELAEQAASGDTLAFEELYRRHSQAAWRVAQSVTGNKHDAADAVADAFTRVFQALPTGRLREGAAFRPYLLSATRNAALDNLRRTGRVRPTETGDLDDGMALPDGPSDRAVDSLDRSLVATAFLSLPERWRSVLWLTEVEGIPPKEAAEVLGVSANGVAQLAVRARAGLRERYLQAHLADSVPARCRTTVDHLGAYVAGGLAPRDIAKVDQHLAGCTACTRRRDELEDLGGRLRRAVVPIPLALAAVSLTRFKAGQNVAFTALRPFAGPLGDPATIAKARKPLMMSAVGLMALGFIGLGVVRPGPGPDDSLAAPRPVRPGVNPPVAFLPAVEQDDASISLGASAAAPFAGEVVEARGDAALPVGPAAPARPPAAVTAPPTAVPPVAPPPKPVPLVQVTARVDALGPATPVAVALGDGCLGANLAGTVVGCRPEEPAKKGAVSVTTGGSLLGTTGVTL